MAKLSNDELLEAFKEMTLIELSEFVTLFEDTFNVTAAAPVAAAAAPAAGGGDAGAALAGPLSITPKRGDGRWTTSPCTGTCSTSWNTPQ